MNPPTVADGRSGASLPPRAVVVPWPERQAMGSKTRTRQRLRGSTIESLSLFAGFTAAYFALGAWITVHLHVIPGDGLSRLSHAYSVFYNEPPKLAAVGFEWPPLDTLALLPFTVVKPLATSLYGLPLSSAICGALTIVVLNRALVMCEMRWPLRYPLLVAFAVNPMMAYYSSNGMGEALGMFLISLAIYLFLRWWVFDEDHILILAGITMGVAFLARFELLAWAPLVALTLFFALRQQRAGPEQVEGSLLAYAGPVVFLSLLWCLFNYLILGSPLYWLEIQSKANLEQARGAAPRGFLDIVTATGEVSTRVFLLIPVVSIALLVFAIVKRNLMSLMLAFAVSLNAITTVGLLMLTPSEDLLRLRYNMRAMPLAVIGVGWLFFCFRRRLSRMLVWGVALACLIVAIPVSAAVMRQGDGTYYEDAFMRALETGKDQESAIATSSANGQATTGGDAAMAGYIERKLPHGGNRIVADDGQLFGVILLTGHPEWFLDRVDRSDTYFKDVVRKPYRRVDGRYVRRADYFLMRKDKTTSNPDVIREAYPNAPEGKVSWLRPVYDAGHYALLEVVPPQRVSPALRRRLAGLPPLPVAPARSRPASSR